ncbi:class I SAM-dependent methyltransferase [Rubripirellula tenax]|uniref:class I SAM-dependent methyltransferase n=1 Tax=Rubripirellula tenax TaxID=2528015 RepID=UPI0011B73595|nr:class I SAM-dependent methyltransferase [Rubripirellula tenax]
MWSRPPGVAPGTWQYVHQRSIADHYDAFVEDAAVCQVDAEILLNEFPGVEEADSRREMVLDLGCGTGRTALPLARRGYDVIGIDLSEPMLNVLVHKIAAEKYAAESSPGSVYPVKANLVDLGGIADGAADHAVCLFATMGMIQGRSNRRTFLRHIARIVRPGGKFVIHVHNRWAAMCEPGGYGSLIRSRLRSIQKKHYEFGDSTYAYRGLSGMFMHRFSRTELVRDLSSSGWSVDRCLRLSIEADRILGRGGVAGGFIVVATRS